MKPRTMLSTSSCRITRQRVAPSAMRTAISRERCAERDSSRLATFAHAISRTNPTAPIIDRNTALIEPPLNRSLKVATAMRVNSLFVSGYWAASRAAMVFISVCACAREYSCFSRPNTLRGRLPRFSCSTVGMKGAHISAPVGNFIPSGITPMIVAGWPFTRIGRPMTPASEP